MRTAVLGNLARGTNPEPGAETRVTTWINQAIREDLCASHYWGSMFTRQTAYLTAGSNVFAYPEPDVWKFTSQVGWRDSATSAYRELTEATLSQVLYDHPRTSTGAPKFWCKRGDGWMVIPTPDVSTYQVEHIGWRYPSDLVSGADTNAFTLYYSRLVEGLATMRGWFHYGELEKMQLWKQLVDEWMAKALAIDKERTLPFKLTYLPGDEAGRSRLPYSSEEWGQPYDWMSP